MADPRPLTRKELAEFLPSQRAIRAFEELFNLIPSQLEETSSFAEDVLSWVTSARAENLTLRAQINALEVQLALQAKMNLTTLENRVSLIESQLLSRSQPNLSALEKRIEVLEALEI